MPDISGLVTTAVLYTKISEVENKIPNTSCLVTATVLKNARYKWFSDCNCFAYKN